MQPQQIFHRFRQQSVAPLARFGQGVDLLAIEEEKFGHARRHQFAQQIFAFIFAGLAQRAVNPQPQFTGQAAVWLLPPSLQAILAALTQENVVKF